MPRATALVTGITGQDGPYLVLPPHPGLSVVGMVLRASTETFKRIEHLRGRVEICQADLLDQLSLINLLRQTRPREVYNLAAQSFVPTSFEQPVLIGNHLTGFNLQSGAQKGFGDDRPA